MNIMNIKILQTYFEEKDSKIKRRASVDFKHAYFQIKAGVG